MTLDDMPVARLSNAEIQKLIDAHFAASNTLETAISQLRACKVTGTAERELEALNKEIGLRLYDLCTERGYRSRSAEKGVAA